MLKEALSLKFGGLEELGEKMCIIGELGKLLLEEIPLEETPPGYGRAPYNGYEKTVNAVNEAARCVSVAHESRLSMILICCSYPESSSTRQTASRSRQVYRITKRRHRSPRLHCITTE